MLFPQDMNSSRDTKPSVIAEARGASRWMTILAFHDLTIAVGVVAVTALLLTEGGFFLLPFGAAFFVFFGYRGYHQARAAWKLRRGIEKHDGATFAAGFVHLRRLLVLTFIVNLAGLVVTGGW